MLKFYRVPITKRSKS